MLCRESDISPNIFPSGLRKQPDRTPENALEFVGSDRPSRPAPRIRGRAARDGRIPFSEREFASATGRQVIRAPDAGAEPGSCSVRKPGPDHPYAAGPKQFDGLVRHVFVIGKFETHALDDPSISPSSADERPYNSHTISLSAWRSQAPAFSARHRFDLSLTSRQLGILILRRYCAWKRR